MLSADPAALSLVFVTTTLGGAAGIIGATAVSWLTKGKPDLSMALNGALAGLVSITAGADQLLPLSSIVVGLIGGILVVGSIALLDQLQIDDPVSAISVHLACGIWGTLAVGIFGTLASPAQFLSQVIGVLSVAAFCTFFAATVFGVIRWVTPLRVSPEEERLGLDLGEHGEVAYGFMAPQFGFEWEARGSSGEVPPRHAFASKMD